MRYCFETFTADKQRRDTTTKVNDIPKDAFANGGYVVVSDNLKRCLDFVVTTQDALDEHYEMLCRQEQWKDASQRAADSAELASMKPHDFLSEDDGFHVKRVDEQLYGTVNDAAMDRLIRNGTDVSHLTLGQLKLEDSNVKTLAAAGKPRIAAVPPIAIMAMGAAMQNGADKYGLFNWRGTAVTATVFYNAMMRHLEQWYSGEQHASDSNIHHLAHLMAGAAIILDAEMNNVFVDDRPKGVALGDDYAKYFMKQQDAA